MNNKARNEAGSWSSSARGLIERAIAIGAEKRAAPTTLHLLAAVMESPASLARLLRAKGVRVQDLRSAAKVHGEPDGVFERVQMRAFKIAEPAPEVSSLHLVSAALSEPQSAFASMLLQLGCDPLVVAHEVLREGRAPTQTLTAQTQSVLRSMRVEGRSEGRGDGRTEGAPRPTVSAPQRNAPVSPRPMGTTTDPRPIRARTAPSAPNGRVSSQKPRVESHGAFDPRSFPVLSALSASEPSSVEVFEGRQTELARVADALERREGRGALLVGMSGVGKSTVLRALREARGGAVVVLRHASVVGELRLAPERARMLCEEIARAAQTVAGFALALDPMAQWFTTREAPEELVLELRAMLSSARVPWVGALTHEELRRLAELEPWIDRGAVKIELDELPQERSRAAVVAHARSLEKHYTVGVSEELALRAWSLTDRYLGGRAQPDRTLNTLDLALARSKRMGARTLDAQTLAAVVSELGGLPLERVAATDSERLLSLESHLAERVVGHREAISRIAQTLRRNAVGFRGQRPIGTFLLLGPTGVGKTETAKAIAEALFPGVGSMSRFDLAEFSEAHAVARLVGAPPGYVGYTDGGQLTEAVRRRPYQLVLLDEIEKAHRDVLEALLALLDEGRMTDGRGRTVDFRNTVVVMTSNLGADAVSEGASVGRSIGFGAVERRDSKGLDVNDRVLASARAALAPELWNRIDETLVYGPLARSEVAEVARRLLAETFRRLAKEQSVQAEATPALIELLLARGGYDPTLGARPMRRTIARLVEAPLAEAVLRRELRSGDRVRVDAHEGAVVIVRDAPAEAKGPGVLPTTCVSGRKGACGA